MHSRPRTTSRILLAWEYGRNLGHLVRLSELASAIKARGREVAWAVPGAYTEASLVSSRGEPIHVAPIPPPAKVRPLASGQHAVMDMLSFADVLRIGGLAHAEVVQSMVAGWLRLYDAIRPGAVLCDYAPFALLAARAAGIAVSRISNGFDAPPIHFPLFPSRMRGPYLERANARRVEQLAESIDRAGRALGITGLGLDALVAGSNLGIDALPETDPYGARAGALYVGPFISTSNTNRPVWKGEAGEKRVFAYLRGREAMPLLEALNVLPLDVCCYWPDAPPSASGRFGNRIHLSRNAQNLPLALAQANAVINYGSSGVLNATLLAGKPQLMVPFDTEKLMFAQRVAHQGAGLTWQRGGAPLSHAIDRLLNDAALTASAQRIAHRYENGQLARGRSAFLDRLLSDAGRANSSAS